MFPTGLESLDGFLHGGIPGGVVVDVFGSNGTGKTQMLFQLACSAASTDRVLYIDTTGSFRPERILEVRRDGQSGDDLLERIAVMRVTNTYEQLATMGVIADSDFGLILVDNVTDLFSYEYHDGGQALEKNLLFMRYMHGLSLYAVCSRTPVVLTNMVRQVDDLQVENMHNVIDVFTHIKISLFRHGDGFSGRAEWPYSSLDFSYRIGRHGLEDMRPNLFNGHV